LAFRRSQRYEPRTLRFARASLSALTTMDAVRAGMRGGLRAAGAYDAVHKDECAFSFHTPYSTPAGLLLNLHTLRAVSDEFLAADHARSGGVLYLRMQYTKVRVPRPPRTKP
jgi:hypothetical protein